MKYLLLLLCFAAISCQPTATDKQQLIRDLSIAYKSCKDHDRKTTATYTKDAYVIYKRCHELVGQPLSDAKLCFPDLTYKADSGEYIASFRGMFTTVICIRTDNSGIITATEVTD